MCCKWTGRRKNVVNGRERVRFSKGHRSAQQGVCGAGGRCWRVCSRGLGASEDAIPCPSCKVRPWKRARGLGPETGSAACRLRPDHSPAVTCVACRWVQHADGSPGRCGCCYRLRPLALLPQSLYGRLERPRSRSGTLASSRPCPPDRLSLAQLTRAHQTTVTHPEMQTTGQHRNSAAAGWNEMSTGGSCEPSCEPPRLTQLQLFLELR